MRALPLFGLERAGKEAPRLWGRPKLLTFALQLGSEPDAFSCSSVLPCPSEIGVESFRQHHSPRSTRIGSTGHSKTSISRSSNEERKVFVPEEKKWHFPSAYYLSQRYLTLFAVGLAG